MGRHVKAAREHRYRMDVSHAIAEAFSLGFDGSPLNEDRAREVIRILLCELMKVTEDRTEVISGLARTAEIEAANRTLMEELLRLREEIPEQKPAPWEVAEAKRARDDYY